MIIHFCLREDDGDLYTGENLFRAEPLIIMFAKHCLPKKQSVSLICRFPKSSGNAMDLWIQNFISMIES